MSIGNVLKEHNAICGYIFDDYGNRIGVTVAMKSEFGKHHPKVGYALYKEVECNYKEVNTLDGYPIIKEYFNYINNFIKNSDSSNTVKSVVTATLDTVKKYCKVGTTTYITPASEADKEELFDIAIMRANCSSWDFFASREDLGIYSQNTSDLRNDVIHYYDWYNEEEVTSCYAPRLAAGIRKAVRKIEYRAYKYFKD